MKILLTTGQEITVSQITAIKPLRDNTTLLSFRSGARRKVEQVFCNMSYPQLIEQIQTIAGNLDAYGAYQGGKDYEYIHRISLIRENDNTAHAELCPLCGNVRKVYHTNRCSCRVTKPFDGKVTITGDGEALKMTKQPLYINEQDVKENPCLSKVRLDRYGSATIERTINNVSIHPDGHLEGEITVNGLSMPVSASMPNGIQSLAELAKSPTRAFWEV